MLVQVTCQVVVLIHLQLHPPSHQTVRGHCLERQLGLQKHLDRHRRLFLEFEVSVLRSWKLVLFLGAPFPQHPRTLRPPGYPPHQKHLLSFLADRHLQRLLVEES